jgi:hypothetical protein
MQMTPNSQMEAKQPTMMGPIVKSLLIGGTNDAVAMLEGRRVLGIIWLVQRV